MGQSVPTPTGEVQDFETRLKDFRRELPRTRRDAFDDLLQAAYRTAAARNRAGSMDPRSNILFSMLLHTHAQLRATLERVERLERQADGEPVGLLAGQLPGARWTAHQGVGQERLPA